MSGGGRCLIQQAAQRQRGSRMEFGAAHGAVVIAISGRELALDQGEVLVLGQRAVVIAVRPAELGNGQAPTAELRTGELARSMTIEAVEQACRSVLCFLERDRAVAVLVD